jgi:hypothetical protein
MLIACIVALTGCVALAPEATEATWVPLGLIDSTSTSLEIGVTRTDCANGVTGELQDPLISYTDERVIITARVEPNGLTEANCQGNDTVSTVIELSEPVGDRELFDGICLDRTKRDYAWCRDDGGVRWAPSADGSDEDVVSIAVDNWVVIDGILETVITSSTIGGDVTAAQTAARVRQAGWDAANAHPGESGESGWPPSGAVLKVRLKPSGGAFVIAELDAAHNAAIIAGNDGRLEAESEAAFSAAWEVRN